MPAQPYQFTLGSFKTGIALLSRGAANELIELHNISQPEADIMVLQSLFSQLDAQADLPTILVGPVLDAIRASVENEHADALAAVEAKCPQALRAQQLLKQWRWGLKG